MIDRLTTEMRAVFLRLERRRLRKSYFSDLHLTLDEAERFHFAFLGEFGYELISWAPYLAYLHKQFGLRPNIVGRAGGEIFYPFSKSYRTAPSELFSDCFGSARDYGSLRKLLKNNGFDNVHLVHPISEWPERRIEISGCSWDVQDIHSDIHSGYYEPLDLSHVEVDLPFVSDSPYIVINNKTYSQHRGVENVYRGGDLVLLADFFRSMGLTVVYNCFFDERLDAVSTRLSLEDDDIFGYDQKSFDMRKFYEREKSALQRNQVQVTMFKKAKLVVGTQGGNAYMPALCGCNQVLLMRGGVYKDYQELSRIYRTRINCFYEVEHILLFLREYFSKHRE